MKQIYIITIISLLNLNFLNAQTVTIDDPTLGASATYTFTYVTTGEIGTGTSTPNVFYFILPSGYPNISPAVADGNLLDPYVTFKIDGVSYLCSSSFGTVGGAWSTGIQLSVGGASSGITIPAGSTIEIIVSNLMTNPSTANSYTFNWKTSEGSGASTENFSYVVDFSTLSTLDMGLNDKKITLLPNPSSDFLKVSGLTRTENYKIYNALGAEVNNGIISDSEKIHIQNLTNGLYFLKFKDGNTIKFLKE